MKNEQTAEAGLLVKDIPLTDIYPSPFNPEGRIDPDTLTDLVESIKVHGVKQPIKVRPCKNRKGYEVVFGDRRQAASRLAGLKTVPATIEDLTDFEARDLHIMENLQREDLSPLDEAASFEELLGSEYGEKRPANANDWLASKVGMPIRYVSQRLKLNDLIPTAAEYVRKDQLPIGHAILIATLTPAAQTEALNSCMQKDFSNMESDDKICNKTLTQLKSYINSTVAIDMGKAKFNLDDANLVPGCVACKDCTKRTCNAQVLFSDITSDDQCTDRKCFDAKTKADFDNKVNAAKEEFPSLKTGVKGWNSKEIKVGNTNGKIVAAPTKKTVPVIITKQTNNRTDEIGEVVHVLLEENKPKPAVSASAPQESYQDRMKREFIEGDYPKYLKLADLIRTRVSIDGDAIFGAWGKVLKQSLIALLIDGFGQEITTLEALVKSIEKGATMTAEQLYVFNDAADTDDVKLIKIHNSYPIFKLILLHTMLEVERQSGTDNFPSLDEFTKLIKPLQTSTIPADQKKGLKQLLGETKPPVKAAAKKVPAKKATPAKKVAAKKPITKPAKKKGAKK